ncbi:methionine aminotransferase [Flavobacterium gawalongense]|uniref:Aminotransferase class I/II-fold pyridoxal phosphate-dependent enzyme n=1 Tax=Flavobacterium gawalongense TaxID=2594432 RepID=A0A553BQS5_9FLAO|nr:methionine aminotransferase [Flavobacterium gawalongense]TRW99788.1 aminotransferase class I/II-fold pyridoxal phosphate-dependent enzyme [Flavobacterium gawalongense]TRX04094.1 aminotransferase class I/II-fold pyridoxal phosphate-dependent enzyme [Flavobacterium gawalongense]TRX10579.1 aminotransferase class I/II-fold pyridoxal phosphate-dependent enzyme [Flavobacterium gawalongense]TRX11728.1 aminotransferase class I/II-fold pyridoxal phosphate-dependent enzyme [Flavobacterium gawalongense
MSKLPNISTSIFTVMSKMATEHNAINLSQGFPNFPVNERLTDIVAKLAKENVHQYLPMSGYPPLLSKIATLVDDSYGRIIQAETEILVTAGATQGIFTTILTLVKTNDEVIILDPSYDCYEAPVLLCNANPVRVALNDDYTPNWATIEKVCSSKTKMIIINNPHNPTGKILTKSDFEALEILLEKYPDILLLSDEVYEYITFEEKHISAHTREKLLHRCVIVSSFGKSFHVTGWKVGYLVAPENLMKEIKKVHQFLVFSVNSICQVAISDYLDLVSVDEIGKLYQEKRDYFRQLLKESRFELMPCEGTYFQVASYAAISNENDVDFCKRLIIEHGVAAIPISTFYADGKDLKLIRFCFAKDNTTLEEATKRLCAI